MREVQVQAGTVHVAALDAALRAALTTCKGLSTYGAGRPISIWLHDSALPADDATAQSIAAAHDPVFLSADKTTIKADGVDTATVTVAAPNVNAAPVNLIVNGQVVPVTLTNGIGTVQVTSLDPTIITVTVQSSANRTTDSIEVQAI